MKKELNAEEDYYEEGAYHRDAGSGKVNTIYYILLNNY